MNSRDVLLAAYDNIAGLVRSTVEGLSAAQLSARPEGHPDANPIGWLVWHASRVQDDHLADAAGSEQVYTSGGWLQRFDLSLEDPMAIGYGFSAAQVDAVRITSPGLLADYHAAVHARTTEFLGALGDDDLDRVVDERWDPPVTLGVRLVSVLTDDLQHLGQAGYLRGLLGEG